MSTLEDLVCFLETVGFDNQNALGWLSSNHTRMRAKLSQPVASSAYHTCRQSGCSFLSSGTKAKAYIAMARGHPCVASCDSSSKEPLSSVMKMRVETLYALMSTNFITGQVYWTFHR